MIACGGPEVIGETHSPRCGKTPAPAGRRWGGYGRPRRPPGVPATSGTPAAFVGRVRVSPKRESAVSLIRRVPSVVDERGDMTNVVAGREIVISTPAVQLPGSLTVPEDAAGVVAFAHGSGSSRLSPRNRYVAEVLHGSRLATLLFDLLTLDEERDRRNVFDVPLLASRLLTATAHLRGEPEVAGLPVGYFGASTGAAAALWAAADDRNIAAVVSRGGRPDLAGPRLAEVRAPTLLIVGSRDELVLELNHAALDRLTCEAEVRLVAGATHLFEEPGALDEVAGLARDWFVRHLARVEAQPYLG